MQVPPSSGCPCPRSFAALAALPKHQLLLFGGLDGSERRLDDTWIFDTVTWATDQPACRHLLCKQLPTTPFLAESV